MNTHRYTKPNDPTRPIRIREATFERDFKPKLAPGVTEEDARLGRVSWSGWLHEPHNGKHMEQVRAAHPSCVWTLYDVDGRWALLSGQGFVNRYAYIITENAVPPCVDVEVVGVNS